MAEDKLILTGRVGHGAFINGEYELQDEIVNNKPVYKSKHAIGKGFGEASGENIVLYYHSDNDAWVLSHAINSLDVLGYTPSHIKNIWHVNNGKGPFIPDPSVKLVAANGQVLTNLGAWTVGADGEVALKMERDGAGSERPLTVAEFLAGTAQRFPDEKALASMAVDGQWQYRSYRQFYEEVVTVAKAFVKIGLTPGQSVCILGSNSAEWVIASLAANIAGGLSVGVYQEAVSDEVEYICSSTKANIIVVEGGQEMERIMSIRSSLPNLRAIVQYRGRPEGGEQGLSYAWGDIVATGREQPEGSSVEQELKKRQASLRANKAAAVAFTAGTTGAMKGCVMSHDNLTWTARSVSGAMELESAKEVFMSFLPLAHLPTQMMEMWLPLACAGTIYFPNTRGFEAGPIVEGLKAVRPTVFTGIPSIWNMLMDRGSGEKKLSNWARRKGLKGSMKLARGESPSWKFKLAEKKSFSKIKKALGLDRVNVALTHTTKINPSTLEYFQSINLPVLEFYSSTETSGPATLTNLEGMVPRAMGKVYPGVQIRLTQGAHELLAYGRHVFMGYLNDAETTSDVIDERGWYHTGDIGQADRAQYVYHTGRVQEVITTAGGEHLIRTPIQNRIKGCMSIVDEAVISGEKRKALVALITVKTETDDRGNPTDRLSEDAVAFVKEAGTQCYTAQDCVRDQKLRAHMQSILDELNEKATSAAKKVDQFQIIPTPFSRAGGELGPLGRLRVVSVCDKYQSTITEMYGGKQVDDYESADWYHGPIQRAEVTKLMKRDGASDGWFLVRQSTKEKNTFVVSLCYKKKLYHNKVLYDDGVYSTHKEQGDHQYESLSQLVAHHKEGKNGYQTKLSTPAKKF